MVYIKYLVFSLEYGKYFIDSVGYLLLVLSFREGCER